jgi:hypothetical protein
MNLIADQCPPCRQVTRCRVVERKSFVAGMMFGIPFMLPLGSVSFVCEDCGCEFHSETWDYLNSVSSAEAYALDLDTLLDRTNPGLKETLALGELRSVPELGEAFALLGKLRPGPLRNELRETIRQWPWRDGFVAKVHDTTAALDFAKRLAGQYRPAVLGCVMGLILCIAVWALCVALLPIRLNVWTLVCILFAGLIAGALPGQFFAMLRDRRWIRDVLLPQAEQEKIRLPALLAILDDGSPTQRVEDGLALLRSLPPTIRGQMAARGVDTSALRFRVPIKE